MQMFKAHGTGNDFVVIPDPDGVVDLDATAVIALCDRRLGIGADGVIRLAPSPDGHVFMDYRNGGDGSIVEMCGNGVRVVAAHLVEHGWTDDRVLRIDTRDGVKRAIWGPRALAHPTSRSSRPCSARMASTALRLTATCSRR
jgi:diaminopimelate epimerase